MVRRACYDKLADSIDATVMSSALDELASATRKMARERRITVKHDRGDVIL